MNCQWHTGHTLSTSLAISISTLQDHEESTLRRPLQGRRSSQPSASHNSGCRTASSYMSQEELADDDDADGDHDDDDDHDHDHGVEEEGEEETKKM